MFIDKSSKFYTSSPVNVETENIDFCKGNNLFDNDCKCFAEECKLESTENESDCDKSCHKKNF